ncbi:RND transporter [Brachybacterium endophyticum]|uniref:RND transporter n=1 Tax=Brachybacterium endophyticum TaxID=2182385 RepID=A0A2U2RIN3_9MICO|nr:MMPL family transporter [Brachybacterium endophyticum]PWH05718.1 RND transporter [Brachybacterium endophyticum]
MSSTLYRLGRAMARARWKAVGTWLSLLVVMGVLAVGLGGAFSTQFEIPGTQAQEGLDELADRFPQMSGTGGQLVFVATDGTTVDDHEKRIDRTMEDVSDVQGIQSAPSPFDDQSPGTRADDDSAIIGSLQMEGSPGAFPDGALEKLETIADDANTEGLEVHLGGQILQSSEVPMGPGEVIGLLAALIILAVAFRSVVPAFIPIVSAVVGVGVSILAVMALSSAMEIPSVTISLGAMLGLAVGIDYALFILSRHRSQLARGTDVEESIGEATATSGSAVIFAGLTVVIALVGLFVTRIPFLNIMGIAAAATVSVSVLVALTLLPAIMGLMGERLRPRKVRRAMAANGGVLPEPEQDASARPAGRSRWVRLVTKVPVVTILVVVVAIGALAIPIKDLRLGLPDLGTEKPDTDARQTYDLVAKDFGAGYNGPLLVTADIINSDDPLGAVDDLEKRIEDLPHVHEVQLATPNEGADMAVVVVIPDGSQTDESTADLVKTMRSDSSSWEKDLDISDVRVTGQTAVAIDITDRLTDALLPFGVFVVGLSLILLMVVFRSIWVPLKASLGYLLSVGAAFGVVAMVFEYGWGNEALGIHVVGPVIAFMPIMCMGVLFGLAMDYEVFLVSRMREEYVHTGDAHGAIERGFSASAPVVIAAALIMFSVFASFVPGGSFMLQPIAIALAVGVLVDAFVVRMTLVPAVLALLGRHAWWLPRWLDALLPRLDIEGEGLAAVLEHREWTAEHGDMAVRMEDLVVPLVGESGRLGPLTGALEPGSLLVARSADDAARATFLDLVSGRLAPRSGILAVHDRLAPDDLGAIQSRVHRIGPGEDILGRIREIHGRGSGQQLVVIDQITDLAHAADLTAGEAVHRLEELMRGGTAVIAGSRVDSGLEASQAEQRVIDALEDPDRHIALRVHRAPSSAAVVEGAHA